MSGFDYGRDNLRPDWYDDAQRARFDRGAGQPTASPAAALRFVADRAQPALVVLRGDGWSRVELKGAGALDKCARLLDGWASRDPGQPWPRTAPPRK